MSHHQPAANEHKNNIDSDSFSGAVASTPPSYDRITNRVERLLADANGTDTPFPQLLYDSKSCFIEDRYPVDDIYTMYIIQYIFRRRMAEDPPLAADNARHCYNVLYRYFLRIKAVLHNPYHAEWSDPVRMFLGEEEEHGFYACIAELFDTDVHQWEEWAGALGLFAADRDILEYRRGLLMLWLKENGELGKWEELRERVESRWDGGVMDDEEYLASLELEEEDEMNDIEDCSQTPPRSSSLLPSNQCYLFSILPAIPSMLMDATKSLRPPVRIRPMVNRIPLHR